MRSTQRSRLAEKRCASHLQPLPWAGARLAEIWRMNPWPRHTSKDRRRCCGRHARRFAGNGARSKALNTIRPAAIKDFASTRFQGLLLEHSRTDALPRLDIAGPGTGSYLCAACTCGQAIFTWQLREYGWCPATVQPAGEEFERADNYQVWKRVTARKFES